MSLPSFASEIQFQFSRSGGKGGQNVNKVETAATGFWNIPNSHIISASQQALLLQKLAHRLSTDGTLIIKSQTHRSQLSNKLEVIEKFKQVVEKALQPKRMRIATKPGRAARENRIEQKKQRSELKSSRSKINW